MRYDEMVQGIAELTHEVNRVYCRTIGDVSHADWQHAPAWQRDSAIAGVRATIAGQLRTPEQSHESWCDYKRAEGWTHGPEKDPEKKTHPCLVPYADLPIAQQAKDALFQVVVVFAARMLTPLLKDGSHKMPAESLAEKPMSDQERLDNWFCYHPPIEDQSQRYERIRAGAKAFAELIMELCPPSADRTAAVRKLREVVYTANASIACGGQ